MSEVTGDIQAASPAVETPSAPEQVAPADTGAVAAPVAESNPAVEGDTSGQHQGNTIPYDRFNQVVQERNQLRESQAQYEQQLQQYGQQLQQLQSRDPVQELLQRLQPQQAEQDPYADPLERELAATKEQLNSVLQWKQQQEQQAQVAQWRQFYDNVTQQALTEFPNADVNAIKFALHGSVNNPQAAAQIAKEAAKASHERMMQFAQSYKPTTPPPQGMVPNNTGGFNYEKPADSFDEARDRLTYMLQNGGTIR